MEILYRDDRVIVCVKPAGVLSTDEPGGMPERLREALGDPDAVVKSVHRLDRTVGGVMVYARTKRAASDLSREIEEGGFRKEYLAVVHGCPESEHGTLTDHLLRDRERHRSYVVSTDTEGAAEAVLDYSLVERVGDLSLLSIRLRTGRTHQIRCQLSHRGYPIVGDRKYGVPDEAEHIALWSHIIGFIHPRTQRQMVFAYKPIDIYPWNLFNDQNTVYDYTTLSTY